MENENESVFANGEREEVRREIGLQMLRGAVIAALVVFGPILFVYSIYLLGLLLPPESKEADDPTPDSFSWITVEPTFGLAHPTKLN